MSDRIETPCQTGRLCLVPKYRNEILEGVESESVKQLAVEAVESSCDHETHPDDWFEDPGAGYGTPPYWRSQRARARCFNQCPIRMECLQKGLEDDTIDHGVMGGYTSAQRKQLRRLLDGTDQARKAKQAAADKQKEDPDAETKQPSALSADQQAAEQGRTH